MLLHDHNYIEVTWKVFSSDPLLTLADCADVSAIFFLVVWVAMTSIVLNAQEGASSTIGAVVILFTVGVAERWSHRGR